MMAKLGQYEDRYAELQRAVLDPDLVRDQQRYRDTMREHAHVGEIVNAYHEYAELVRKRDEARELAHEESDPELRAMAGEEAESLDAELERKEAHLKILLVPKDPIDDKNTIIEIRAGTGGEEAALFASDLYRMYLRYAERVGWKTEVMTVNETEIGGYKEIVFSVSGKNCFGDLRYESGGHRVQRVPETESGGRIHTSAVTVAVLPEAEETDIRINQEDLRVDVYRSSGPGGQSVNTTDSAVRMTHIPTGLVVTCQDEKSQLKNKAKALRVLKARLFELEESKRQAERSLQRKTMIGSGDRSERIRTYNFPQNRVTDHRIGLTLYRLDSVLQGELEAVIEPLKLAATDESLRDGTG